MKMSTYIGCALVVAFSLHGASASDPRGDTPDGKRALKVFAIGNSYAESLLRQMPQVAADMGVTLDLLVANIGGCSLEKHVKLMENPKLDPHGRPWSCEYRYADGGRPNLPNREWNFLRDAILADDWDVITVQQASHDSWQGEKYRPWGDNLVGRVRALCPNAEIVVQETWSDPPGADRLKKWKLSSEEMYARLHAAYADFAKPYGLRIIPTGTAVEKARAFGMMQKKVNDPHLNAAGEFLQALVWTEKLFGVDVTKGAYVPEGMDAGLAKNLRTVAHEAVAGKSPDEVRDAVVPSERGVKVASDDDRWDWIDGKDLPMEGRAFADALTPYCRLPASAKDNVVWGIWQMSQCTAGMQFRFTTDSRKLKIVWSLNSPSLYARNIPLCTRSGLDVYAWRTKRPDGTVTDGEWWFEKALTPSGQFTNACEIAWGGEKVPCLVNLPQYNGIGEFRLGVEKGCKVKPLDVPHRSGVSKPVVFYGGSIVQGASASRPGTCWPNLVGRMLDVSIVNMGFNGQGKMEDVFVDYLASVDASCYVFMNFGNMGIDLCEERYEKFLRALHARRPDAPLVIGQHCYYLNSRGPLHAFAPKMIERLRKEDPAFAKCLHLVRLEDMFAPDSDGTIDGGHPNDWGSMHMAKAFSAVIADALNLK